ncbi:SMC-Scp complex subunit ScpB [Candidatus Kaiserbacteria bacterium]|nr:SMC-Scp complex subunit ScpB [Candidatus Kaiserbacteria bacterium]MCB9811815.1 SMC-Scp complex subunit ScpB [Candidatus Nomurabacteria bacterium]
MELPQQLEAVLFYKAAPMKITALAKLFSVSEDDLKKVAETLSETLTGRGVALIMTDTELDLRTAPEADQLIEAIRKDEMKRDIGKAGAETLAIVLYRGPISRAEIDRIRGVNSAYILRSLMVRGLIEKNTASKQVQFMPTTDLLAHLGITERTKAPDFDQVMAALDAYERTKTEETMV